MKIVLRTVLVLLLLPVLAFSGVYLYGKLMVWYLLARQEATELSEDIASRAGNGFGGEVGMEVVDSGYWSDKFYWIDDDHLVFNKKWAAGEDMNESVVYVWDLKRNVIKPIDIYGRLFCARSSDVYFYSGEAERNTADAPRPFSNIVRARLVEKKHSWQLQDAKKLTDIWSPPSDRYELAWKVRCLPWFQVKSDSIVDEDVPEHRFKYLWEWGWVLRMPKIGANHYDQAIPEMGFFDIGGEVYSGQGGDKVAALIGMPKEDLFNLNVRYVHFLDQYLLASRLNGSETKKKVLEFISRDGQIKAVKGMPDWPKYSEIPLPTRKGIFWSGYDYRLDDPTPYDSGAFIRSSGGKIHKVIKGNALKPQLSNDGCRVAFYSSPKRVRGISSLKVFDACSSKLTQKELRDYDYQYGITFSPGPGVS
jgi:hypothetical protein